MKDLRVGEGVPARAGDELVTKLVAVYVTGRRLESSWDRGSIPFTFELGAEESSPGWEQGMPGMRVGGRRELIVPPDLSSRFGTPAGSGPEDTLVYVVDLIGILPPGLVSRGEPTLAARTGSPPRDLQVRDLDPGTGPAARPGDVLTVEYVGERYDGRPFTNSWKRDKPFQFELGAGEYTVNPGWEEGLPGMRVGGRRELVIPPRLQQQGGVVPRGAGPEDTLVYVIDLVGIAEPKRPASPPG